MGIKVIINNYNYARYLADCLDSALNQTRPFDQVIVVDDGSTDESRTIIEDYRYSNLRLDQKLADAEFDRNNEKYRLRR